MKIPLRTFLDNVNSDAAAILKLLLLPFRLVTASHERVPSLQAARCWIEANFQKRECAKFVPSPKDEHR